MKHLLIAALLCGAAQAHAQSTNLCGMTDEAEVLELLAGNWTREGTMSVFNEVMDELGPMQNVQATLTSDGAASGFAFEDTLGLNVMLALADAPIYDVDHVDNLLDTTERADLADVVADTHCGPEDLPQLTTEIGVTAGMSVTGRITWIGYFDDRILELAEYEVTSDETILFITETAVLTRWAQ